MALVDGQVLDGKYVITRRIAEGGMSTVYLGVNQRIGKDVAVKVLHPSVAREEDVVRRFEREARIVSRIRSPYVADVYDFGALESGEHFMVMEYLDGESLASMIERERTLPVKTLATFASQILSGLASAHNAGVIHRDLKPENIIVLQQGKERSVKIVDFGISKVVDSKSTSIFPEARATAAGAVLGTPLYMSPEQARGATILIDQRTDLYSLGVILYEAIAGEPPLMGDNVNDLLFRVALDEPIPLQVKVPNVDPGFATIVMKAMAKTVTDRYQSSEEMLEALVTWRAQFESGLQAPIPTPPPAINMMSTVTPMTLSVSPHPAEAPRMPVGLYARARRYAVALPAIAVLLFFLPMARQAISKPTTEVAPTVAAEPMPVNERSEMMPQTKLVPIFASAESPIVEPEKKPVAVIPKWTPPAARPMAKKQLTALLVPDAGAADVPAEIATAPTENIAPATEAPAAPTAPPADTSLPPLAPPAQD